MTKKKSKKKPAKSKKTVKIKKNNLYGILAVIAVIIIGLILFFTLKGGTEKETKTTYNLNYILKADGEVLDEKNNYTLTGNNLASVLKINSDKVNNVLNGLSEGETETITLTPEEAYGEYDESLVFEYPRINKNNRTSLLERIMEIPLQTFTQAFGEDPVDDKTYSLAQDPFNYTVLSSNENNVELKREINIGTSFDSGIPGIKQKIVKIKENNITMRLYGNESVVPANENYNITISLDEDYMYFILDPSLGKEIQFQGMPKAIVSEIKEEVVIMDPNNPYAGKTIELTIKVNEKKVEIVNKITGQACTEVENAPKLQVFIMSYCPYGLQALKGMVPVWEKFQGTANIELRFVSYTMHGETEEEENKRMICIREEQCDKLLPYLRCFAGDGDYEKCLTETGVDKTMLGNCMENNADTYMEEDSALNELYGVSGSPTYVFEGQKISAGRSPNEVKELICSGFETAPVECSETLDTASPTPGLGWDSSETGSTGQC